MKKDKLLATPVYDEELEKWIIEVESEGVVVPIGRTVNRAIDLFELCKYDSKEKVIEWLKERSDKFEINM